MRKTLTVISVVLAAGSLAACKMFWEKESPPPTPVAATTDPTTTAEAPKPAEQTASTQTDKPAVLDKTGATSVPATK